jgi:hypothetical protein
MYERILTDLNCLEVSYAELAECLPPFCPEYFVLTFAVQTYKRQNIIIIIIIIYRA